MSENPSSCAPIGIFDSGMGGISVLQSLQSLLPNENYIYIGDSKHAPYGPQTVEAVRSHAKRVVDTLIKDGAKAIVIACNTATSAAATTLRSDYSLPIIGMEPALKPAAMAHPGGTILVLATAMTLKEDKFKDLMAQYEEEVTIIKAPAPEFVDLVESGEPSYQEVFDILDRLVGKDKKATIDGVVLGCTHFIFLKQTISAYFNHRVNIYDGNLGTVIQLKRTLKKLGLLCDSEQPGKVTIYNTAGDHMVERSHELLELLHD